MVTYHKYQSFICQQSYNRQKNIHPKQSHISTKSSLKAFPSSRYCPICYTQNSQTHTLQQICIQNQVCSYKHLLNLSPISLCRKPTKIFPLSLKSILLKLFMSSSFFISTLDFTIKTSKMLMPISSMAAFSDVYPLQVKIMKILLMIQISLLMGYWLSCPKISFQKKKTINPKKALAV